MNILRWIGRGLLLSLTTAGVAVWIWVMTLQITLLNRQAVIGWLENSGAYGTVVDSVVNLSLQQDASGTISQDALQQAIGGTLTPAFVKQVSEAGVNGTFDWLEGKTEKIEFSVPLGDKRDELQQQLATALAPELKDLPACTAGFSGLSVEEAQCLPPDTSAEEAAAATAQQAIGSSDFLTQPITEDMLGTEYQQYTGWLPAFVQSLGWLSIGLPILALATGTGYVFLNQQRLRGIRTLSSTLLFSTALTTVAGIGLWFIGTNVQLEQAAAGDEFAEALLGNVVQPVVAQVLPSVGFWLAVFAGSVALLSLAAWISTVIIGRRKAGQLQVDGPGDSTPTPNHSLSAEGKAPQPIEPNTSTPTDHDNPAKPFGKM